MASTPSGASVEELILLGDALRMQASALDGNPLRKLKLIAEAENK
jgi:hypothetical protein